MSLSEQQKCSCKDCGDDAVWRLKLRGEPQKQVYCGNHMQFFIRLFPNIVSSEPLRKKGWW